MSKEVDLLLIPTGYVIRNVRVCNIDTTINTKTVLSPKKKTAKTLRSATAKRKRDNSKPLTKAEREQIKAEREQLTLKTQKHLAATPKRKLIHMKKSA